MDPLNLEEIVKTNKTAFSLREFLTELNTKYPRGFVSKDAKKMLLNKWGWPIYLGYSRENCYSIHHKFSQGGMPYVLSNLAKGEFLSRELIRDEGPKNRRYKYHVVESKLKEWGEDQIASYYSLMNSYTKFKGERGVEERIKEDRNFLDLMEKIKKINIDCYKQLGGAYLDVILDNSKFNET